MEVARGGGYQAVCAVLEQHTTEDIRSEVSRQLWFVNRLVATTCLAYKRDPPNRYTCTHTCNGSLHTLSLVHT